LIELVGIYKIENKNNGMVYIGQSVSIMTRWEQHISTLSRNKHKSTKMQNDYKKGSICDFDFSVVEIVENKDNLNDREYYWIEYYKAYLDYNTVHRLELCDDYEEARKNNYKDCYEYMDRRLIKNISINFNRTIEYDNLISYVDYEVLLSLCNIAIKSNNNIIRTSYRELSKIMHFPCYGSAIRKRIEKSLYNIKNTLLNIDNESFKIIEDIIFDKNDKDNKTLTIKLNNMFNSDYKSIIKYEDSARLSLKSNLSRIIYLCIKDKYKTKRIKMSMDEFLNLVKMDKNKYYIKQRLEDALTELVANNIIKEYKISNEEIFMIR